MSPSRLLAAGLLAGVLATGCVDATPPEAAVEPAVVTPVPLSPGDVATPTERGGDSLPLVPPSAVAGDPVRVEVTPTTTPTPTPVLEPAQGDPVGTCRVAGSVLEAVEPLVTPRPAGEAPPVAAYTELADAVNGLLGVDAHDADLAARLSAFVADTGVVLGDLVAGTPPAERTPEVQAAFTRFSETVPQLQSLMSALCEQAAVLGIGGVPADVCTALAPLRDLEDFPEGQADYNAVVGSARALLEDAEDASTVTQQTDALVAGQAWWAALGAVGPSASFDLRVARDLLAAPVAYVAVPYDAMLGRCGIG